MNKLSENVSIMTRISSLLSEISNTSMMVHELHTAVFGQTPVSPSSGPHTSSSWISDLHVGLEKAADDLSQARAQIRKIAEEIGLPQ